MKRILTISILALAAIFAPAVHSQSSGTTVPPPPYCTSANAGAIYTDTATSPATVYTCSYYNLSWQWVVNPSYGGLVYYPTIPSTCSGSLPVFLGGWPNTQMYVCVAGVPSVVAGYGSGVTSFTAPSSSWPSWLVPTVIGTDTTPILNVAASTIPLANGGTDATTAPGAQVNLGVAPAITPQQFGAVGDGITNDGPALQSWLNAAVPSSEGIGGTLTCPNATYKTNQQLNIPTSGVLIKGPCTIIAGAAMTALMSVSNGSGVVLWVYLDGVVLEGNNLANYDFYAPYGVAHGAIRNSSFLQHSLLAAVYLGGPGSYDFDILDSEISYNTLDGLDLNIAGGYTNAINIERNKIFGNGGWGLAELGASSVKISGNTFETNAYGAIYESLYGRGLTITENYFEGDALTGYTFNTSTTPATTNSEIVLNGYNGISTLNRAYAPQSVRIGSNFFNLYNGEKSAVFIEGANLQFDNNIARITAGASNTALPAIISYTEPSYGSSFTYPLAAFGNQNFSPILQWYPGNVSGPTISALLPGIVPATELDVIGLNNPTGQPSGTPYATGGTVPASSYNYAQVWAIDSSGLSTHVTLADTISNPVVTTGSASSIKWTWTAPSNTTNQTSFAIAVCNTSSCTPSNCFYTVNSGEGATYTQTSPPSSGAACAVPTVNNTGNINIAGQTGYLYANPTGPVTYVPDPNVTNVYQSISFSPPYDSPYPVCTATAGNGAGLTAPPTWNNATGILTFPGSAISGRNGGSITCTQDTGVWTTQIYPSTGSSPQTVNMATRFAQAGGLWTQINTYGVYTSGGFINGAGNYVIPSTAVGYTGTSSGNVTLSGSPTITGNLTIGPLSTPINSAFSTAVTGGILTDATSYCYRVVAVNSIGVTLPSTETCITTGSGGNLNTVTVNWALVAGNTSYSVYGRTSGAELLMASGLTTNTFLDNGSITPSGALPGSNTSQGTLKLGSVTVIPAGVSGYQGPSTGYTQLMPAPSGAGCAYQNGSGTYSWTNCGSSTSHSIAHGGCGGAFGSAGTYYPLGLGSVATTCSTSTLSYGNGLVMPSTGTLSNLSVRCDATGTASFTVFDAPSGTLAPGTTTGITLNYSTSGGTNQVVQDTTHTAAYNVGDLITVQIVDTTTTLGNCTVSFNY